MVSLTPRKAAQVRDTLRGIQALHPQPLNHAPEVAYLPCLD
ncbi:hypothetical protein ACIPZ5_23975 [Pseudomonas sp. NPDC089428]